MKDRKILIVAIALISAFALVTGALVVPTVNAIVGLHGSGIADQVNQAIQQSQRIGGSGSGSGSGSGGNTANQGIGQ